MADNPLPTRLGLNRSGYNGATIDIHAVLTDLRRAAEHYLWQVEVFGMSEGFPQLAFKRVQPVPAAGGPLPPRFYISAGIHGDEPAGPLAMLQLLHENRWPAGAEIFLCPCLNPGGFAANRRENAQGADLNRDYRETKTPEVQAHLAWLTLQPDFDAALCLHEDWESHGFYVYELNPDRRPSPAEAIVAAVQQVCPLDLSPVIETRPAVGGIIRPELDPRTRPLWPESFWLLQHKSRLGVTLEAPSDFELPVRVAALVAGVRAVLHMGG